jgi:putative membrane protein
VGRGRLESRARAAALAAFRELRVGETRDRTGILIYVSLLERHVVVLPDTGIAARAPEPTWKGVVECIVGGMKAGAPGDGLVAAVGLCGDTLRAAGFAPRPDDTNELPDAGRFGSR